MAGIDPQGGLLGFALAEGHASIIKSKHSVVKMFYWRTARDFIHGRLAHGSVPHPISWTVFLVIIMQQPAVDPWAEDDQLRDRLPFAEN
jgi:hypothetical protein